MSMKKRLIMCSNFVFGSAVGIPSLMFTQGSKILNNIKDSDTDNILKKITKNIDINFTFNNNDLDNTNNEITRANIKNSTSSYSDFISETVEMFKVAGDNNNDDENGDSDNTINFESVEDFGSISISNIDSKIFANGAENPIIEKSSLLERNDFSQWLTKEISNKLKGNNTDYASEIDDYVSFKNQTHEAIGVNNAISIYSGLKIGDSEYNLSGFNETDIIDKDKLTNSNTSPSQVFELKSTITLDVKGGFCIDNSSHESYSNYSSIELPDNGYGLNSSQIIAYLKSDDIWSEIWQETILKEFEIDDSTKNIFEDYSSDLFNFELIKAESSDDDVITPDKQLSNYDISDTSNHKNPFYVKISYNTEEDNNNESVEKITGSYYLLVNGQKNEYSNVSWKYRNTLSAFKSTMNKDAIKTDFVYNNEFILSKESEIGNANDAMAEIVKNLISKIGNASLGNIVGKISIPAAVNKDNQHQANLIRNYLQEYVFDICYTKSVDSTNDFNFTFKENKLYMSSDNELIKDDLGDGDITYSIFGTDTVDNTDLNSNLKWTIFSKKPDQNAELDMNDMDGYVNREKRGYDINYRQLSMMFDVPKESNAKDDEVLNYGYKKNLINKLGKSESDNIVLTGIYVIYKDGYKLKDGCNDVADHYTKWENKVKYKDDSIWESVNNKKDVYLCICDSTDNTLNLVKVININ